jgi:hypothetical protein
LHPDHHDMIDYARADNRLKQRRWPGIASLACLLLGDIAAAIVWHAYRHAGHYGSEYGVILILGPVCLAMVVLALALAVCGLTEAGSRRTSAVALALIAGQLVLLWRIALR